MSGFCDQCGAALGESAKFCASCGSQVVAPTPAPATDAPRPHVPVVRTQPRQAKPPEVKTPRWGRRILIAIGSFFGFLILLGAILSATGSKHASPTSDSSSPSPPSKPAMPQSENDARDWIKSLGLDAGKVQANIDVVKIALGLAIKNSTVANVNKLAQYAQRAHDNLDGIRQDFAQTNKDSGTLGNAELAAFSGANDLKNSMGALVAYTGTPNAATLASFTTQYQKARAEWNYGVRTIWRLAHKKHPPAV